MEGCRDGRREGEDVIDGQVWPGESVWPEGS